MGVGDRIKALLKEKGMSVKGLADRSGVPLNTLYAITKKNGAKTARKDTLQKIAYALGTTTAYLNGETNDPRPVIIDMDFDLEELKASLGTVKKTATEALGTIADSATSTAQMARQLALDYMVLSDEDKEEVRMIIEMKKARNEKGHKDDE